MARWRRACIALTGPALLAALALALPLSGGWAQAPHSQPADWQTYRNEQAGYTVDYPGDWTVTESVGATGALITIFAPPGGGGGVMISVGGPELAGATDLPNTRCQPVTIGGVAGTRCFDTIARSSATTLTSGGRTYVIAAAGRLLDPAVYARVVDSFQLLPPASPPPTRDLTLVCVVSELPAGAPIPVWRVQCTLTGAPADDTSFAVSATTLSGATVCEGTLSNGAGSCEGILQLVARPGQAPGQVQFSARADPSGSTAVGVSPVVQALPGPSTPPPNVPTATAAPGAPRTIHVVDPSQPIELAVGEQFQLDLDGGYDWTVQIADESIVRPMPASPAPPGRVVYEALQPGQTTLLAVGDPPCRKVRPPCMLPSRGLQLQLVVR